MDVSIPNLLVEQIVLRCSRDSGSSFMNNCGVLLELHLDVKVAALLHELTHSHCGVRRRTYITSTSAPRCNQPRHRDRKADLLS